MIGRIGLRLCRLRRRRIIRAQLRVAAQGPTIKALPIDLPTTRRPIAVVTLKGRTVSPVAQAFIDCDREVAKSLA